MKFLTLVILAVAANAALAQAVVPATVAGCRAEDFVQGQAEQIIKIGPQGYTPKCVKVPQGAVVTIQASSVHPLQAMADIDGLTNPFLNQDGPSSSAQAHTLSSAGQLGYFCNRHGKPDGSGMAGSILVEAKVEEVVADVAIDEPVVDPVATPVP